MVLLQCSKILISTFAVWNGVLGKKHFVNKRGLIELYGTLKCGTSRFPLAYVSYGCYCGPGGSGWPTDETDWYVLPTTSFSIKFIFPLHSSTELIPLCLIHFNEVSFTLRQEYLRAMIVQWLESCIAV